MGLFGVFRMPNNPIYQPYHTGSYRPNFTQSILGIRIVLMEIHNLDETSPTPVGEETQEMAPPVDDQPPPEGRRKSRWVSWLL